MTPHINAKLEDISKNVLMPGDPIRAKYISDNFLENCKVVNNTRNMTTYTGYYKGNKITVFPSGMGIPSVGIFSYELYDTYNVENIIRIGTCGSYVDFVNVGDIVLAEDVYSESTFALHHNNYTSNIIKANNSLNIPILDIASKQSIDITKGLIHCSDIFYRDIPDQTIFYKEHKTICVEMESFGLFAVANKLNKSASSLFTVSDSFVTYETMSAKERESSLNTMIKLALDSIISL